jgi:hypothetical protein
VNQFSKTQSPTRRLAVANEKQINRHKQAKAKKFPATEQTHFRRMFLAILIPGEVTFDKHEFTIKIIGLLW